VLSTFWLMIASGRPSRWGTEIDHKHQKLDQGTAYTADGVLMAVTL
jgi:hypothetical protein